MPPSGWGNIDIDERLTDAERETDRDDNESAFGHDHEAAGIYGDAQ